MVRRERSAFPSYVNGASMRDWSRLSLPSIALNTAAQSSTDLQIGPILSIDQLSAIAPFLLTRPYVGRSPVVPQTVEGETIDPHVSVPMENPTSPAAVADAEPADDP